MKAAQVLILLSTLVSGYGYAQELTCPKLSPVEWGAPRQALQEVWILAYPHGTPKPSQSEPPPIVAPTRQVARRGVIHQTWNMNVAPEDDDQIECIYRGMKRTIVLDANNVKRCTAQLKESTGKWLKFSCD